MSSRCSRSASTYVQPKLLLLGEPSLGLSPLMSQEVPGALRELCEQGTTTVVVEQNVHSALIASRAYVFETGRVVAESSAVNISVIPICSAPISVLEETRFEV